MKHEDLKNDAPKYDPCRLFRKGDMVRVKEWNGRDIARVGQIGIVVSNEANSRVELAIDGWRKDVFYPACHLELVTPVEDFFTVEADADEQVYSVTKGTLFVASYGYGPDDFYKKEGAKAAAQAECDRLNELYRKEMGK